MKANSCYLKLTIVTLFLLALPLGLTRAQKETTPAAQAERLDNQVREDFFAGYAGNAEALKRGMAKCEERLKSEPDHAEALAWHGGGLMFQAGQLFAKQDWQRGTELQQQGLAEMDRAVAQRPNDIAILVPRAAFLVTYARFVPNADERAAMLNRAISDFEEVYRQQKTYFDKLSSHSHGELIFGLAEAYLRSGDAEKRAKAHALLKLALTENGYAQEAQTWLQSPADAKPATFAHRCIGCHT